MGSRKNIATCAQIDEGFLSILREHIATREIERGIACLQAHGDLIANCDLQNEDAARFVAHLAVWVDIGFDALPRLKELLRRFEPKYRSRLSLTDYIQLRMAEGMVSMREEAMETAIGHFDFVLSLGE